MNHLLSLVLFLGTLYQTFTKIYKSSKRSIQNVTVFNLVNELKSPKMCEGVMKNSERTLNHVVHLKTNLNLVDVAIICTSENINSFSRIFSVNKRN